MQSWQIKKTGIDYGKFSFVVGLELSQETYLNGMTLDYVTEGLNEYFKFMDFKMKYQHVGVE